jgi:hypothetical protein
MIVSGIYTCQKLFRRNIVFGNVTVSTVINIESTLLEERPITMKTLAVRMNHIQLHKKNKRNYHLLWDIQEHRQNYITRDWNYENEKKLFPLITLENTLWFLFIS